jgi:hypothetical protein
MILFGYSGQYSLHVAAYSTGGLDYSQIILLLQQEYFYTKFVNYGGEVIIILDREATLVQIIALPTLKPKQESFSIGSRK